MTQNPQRHPNRQVPPPPPSMVQGSKSRQRQQKRRTTFGNEWTLVIVAGLLVFVAIASSALVALWFTLSQTQAEVIPTAVIDIPTPVRVVNDYSSVDLSLLSGSLLTLSDGREIIVEAWDGTSRFTILLMGLDRRPGESGLQYRTDTMMLVSLDPQNNSVGILSIPRDLYVSVPGYATLQRINTPMVLGELQCEGCGPNLAMQTAQNNLGIRVNEFIAVDFSAFINFVDLIGGIDVTTTYTINDPAYPNMYYGYDPFYLVAGDHHLDGATALKFARTRHGSSDFERALRQQDVLYAIRDKILQPGTLANLIIQSPTLYLQFQESFISGLSLDQLIQLTLYVKDIPKENIYTGVIDQRYVSNYMTPEGAAVLIPNRSALPSLMIEVFGENYSQ
ncbi:MAG: LCP family protein [Phototrophicaceae bacterium]